MNRILLTSVYILFFTSLLNAQDLANSRRTSEYTHIYELTNEEAQKIYDESLKVIEDNYFHTAVDSFYTDSAYDRQLDYGHYLFVHSVAGKLNISLQSVDNIDVRILNNKNDLQLIVYDKKGEIIENLPMRINNKKVPYNHTSKTYILKKSSQQGLGEIRYNGHVNYFQIRRTFNNKFMVRVGRKIMYAPPIKYVWMPFRDIYSSIRHGYPNGYIWKIVNLFKYGNEKDFSDKFKGYIVFNKPIYKPRDTVRFKAFILKRNNSRYTKDLSVRIGNYQDKYRELGTISPTIDGNYSYEFVLHDSLNFRLDRSIQVYLEKEKYKDVINGSFELEDYELRSTKYTLRSDQKYNRPYQPMSLYLKGVDENKMNLLDAKVEMVVTAEPITEVVSRDVFIPDTLWVHDQALDPIGETKIVLPDSIFPPANFRYTATAVFTNSNNEWETKNLKLNYEHQNSAFAFELKNDSIYINYLKNGIKKRHQAELAVDSKQAEVSSAKIELPYKTKINPYIHSYFIKDSTISKAFWLEKQDDGVSNNSFRTSDSVYIQFDNKHKIPLWYTLFAGKQEVQKGKIDTPIDLKIKAATKKPYFLSLSYMWAGSLEENEYSVPYFDKNLQITTDQPELVTPGQEEEITIAVKDQKGNAIAGVDLTAYAYTSKFGTRGQVPDVPYMGTVYGNRKIFNTFSKQASYLRNKQMNLKWKTWHKKLQLDDIEYYKFLYPKNSVYRRNIPTPDSTTQFSPFVVSNGEAAPIHVIYLNNTPIYYSGVNTISNYSFHVEPNKPYNLKLRTWNKTLEIDSVVFDSGQKNILSIDIYQAPNTVKVIPASLFLSEQEKRHLEYYLIEIQDNLNDSFTYLKQHQKVQLLNKEPNRTSWRRYNEHILAGPFYSDSTEYVVTDRYSTDFILEPNHRYEFSKGLIKMKELENNSKLKKSLLGGSVDQNFGQFATTEKDILDKWEEYKKSQSVINPRYDYPISTADGKSKIRYWLGDSVSLLYPYISRVILQDHRNPNFLRVYQKGMSVFHNLDPSEYTVLFLLSTGEYFKTEPINVNKSGTKYLNINSAVVKPNDESLKEILKILESKAYEQTYIKGEVDQEIRRVKQIINRSRPSSSYQREVSGRITSLGDGSGLPGVNVVIKGTTTGTISDIDGYYTIYVPRGGVLVFSFIGYATDEVEIGSRSIIDIPMSTDVMQLSEVVVTTMGVERKRKAISYSVGTLQGKVAGVRIRGNSTVNAQNTPLLIVDGVPMDGGLSNIDPNTITTTTILKGDAATAIYGARASGGVIIVTTNNEPSRKQVNNPSTFPDTQSAQNSLRNNFSDYAYWQPNLTTDENGKASFKVKFPDDVTNWRTFVLGMDHKKHSGQSESSIKAFKSVTANLALPRFMISSDTVNVIGKSLNYTQDTLNVKTEFKLGVQTVLSNETKLVNSLIDSVLITGSKEDSIQMSYTMKMDDGYFDGELRSIPVLKRGVEESKGFFSVLDQDTTMSVSMDPTLGNVTVYAHSSTIDVLDDEIDYIRAYPYECNEQLASKLHVLLAKKKLDRLKGRKFKYEKEIKSIIRKLQNRQKDNGLWGWWTNSPAELWISNHVMKALKIAEAEGYSVKINTEVLQEDLRWRLSSQSISQKIEALNLLTMIDAPIDYASHIRRMDSDSISLNHFLRLSTLRKKVGLEVKLDSIVGLKSETSMGNVYWKSSYSSTIDNTMLMYGLLEGIDSLKNIRSKTQAYLLNQRGNGHWRNTYISSRIINALLPETVDNNEIHQTQTLKVNDTVINQFPYAMQLNGSDSLLISKTGNAPIYFTAYQETWVDSPKAVEGDIKVTTRFSDNDRTISTGQPIKLIVEVEMKKSAEYVMVEVPIPSGCSYQNKHINYGKEDHREYYKHKTNIYLKRLSEGKHTFTIDLIPRYSGSYTLNPAKVELMYFPTKFGRNQITRVKLVND